MVRLGPSLLDELVSHRLWKRKIREPVPVKVAELDAAHAKLRSPEAVGSGRHPRPLQDGLDNAIVRAAHFCHNPGRRVCISLPPGTKRSNLLNISRAGGRKGYDGDIDRMKRATRLNRTLAQGGSIVPGWAFWTVIAAVALVSGIAVGYLGNPGNIPPAARVRASAPGTPKPTPTPSPTPSPTATSPAGSDAAEETATTSEERPLITDGVTVQVLNASGRREADNHVIRELKHLGYDIVAINPAAKVYQKTTVFWSQSSEKAAATALAEHFSWKSGPRPRNLSRSVTTHVVVGKDES